jgi:hypothetical protein
MIIEANPLSENASVSIRFSREFDSIVTDTCDLQREKQPDPIISIDDGMKIEVNPHSENA